MNGRRILLIVGGGIAAYKSLELVRRLKERGASVRAILTKGGAEFVTPLTLSVLTEEQVYTDLFDLKDEAEMGHIHLSREADLVVVAPATADLLAEDGAWLGRRSRHHRAARHRQAGARRPRHECAHVEHPATRRNLAADAPTASNSSAPTRARWRAASLAPAAWPNRRRSSKPSKSARR